MMRHRHTLARLRIVPLALTLAAAASGCHDAAAHTAVTAWLFCDECSAQQLQAVRALGNRAVPTLAGAMMRPSAAERARVSREVAGAWQQLRAEAQRLQLPGPLEDSSTAVAHYASGYFADKQERAVTALAAVHTQYARLVLMVVVSRDTTGANGMSGSVVQHAAAALATF